jgi:NTE family protein
MKSETDNKSYKKGLALSGGGYRASIYALGSLWRLNEDGLLTELDTITAVSGGAITAAYLMLKWHELEFEPIDVQKRYRAKNFEDIIVKPLLQFFNLRVMSKSRMLLGFINPLSTASKHLTKQYEKLLFGEVKLKNIKENKHSPEFVFYATNYDTGVSVRITKNQLRDYQIGVANNHDISLAEAVTISSGFPPFLSPFMLSGKNWDWNDSKYQKLPTNIINELREKLTLCDGGLYDNMGIEMLWKYDGNREYDTVFSCDAGAPFSLPWKKHLLLRRGWFSQFNRMTDIMINQQRALRKRTLTRNYLNKEYTGAYWSIDSSPIDYKDITPIISEDEVKHYKHLMNLSTKLTPFSKKDTFKLINWSFCHTDMSLRKWYDTGLTLKQRPYKIV